MSSLMPLFDALASYLEPREPWAEFSAAFATAAQRAMPDPGGTVGAWISPALAGTNGDGVVATIRAALNDLRWRQNPNYHDPTFLAGYAYCELLGPIGHARHADLSAGLLCLRPGIHYPPHAHPAHEVYHVVCGTGLWQRGGEAWIAQSTGSRIEHPSGVPHAMRALNEPLLALYLWRGALNVAARLVDQ